METIVDLICTCFAVCFVNFQTNLTTPSLTYWQYIIIKVIKVLLAWLFKIVLSRQKSRHWKRNSALYFYWNKCHSLFFFYFKSKNKFLHVPSSTALISYFLSFSVYYFFIVLVSFLFSDILTSTIIEVKFIDENAHLI